jgi:DNA-3-methyladenine glycosylase
MAIPLPARFYRRSPELVARELLGAMVFRRLPEGLLGGRIVETEAYLADNDPACHAARGPTARNAVMFGPPGFAYVYAIHSRWCLNAVTMPADVGCAVLIRAIEPLIGIEFMQARRPRHELRDLARGPARLCQALAIDKRHNGLDLCSDSPQAELWIAGGKRVADRDVLVSPRIGVTSAHELPLRFFVMNSPFVSRHRKGESLSADVE